MALSAEKIAKLPMTQKLLILGGVVILIFVCYYVFMESNYKQRTQELDSELSSLKADILKITAIAAEKEKFERENALLQKRLDEALMKLPNETEIAELIITISDLGRGNGLSFSSFQPGREGSKPLYIEVPINMKFRGNFFHVLRFFDEISKLPRIVNISDLKVSSGKGEMLDITCTAETYKFKETTAKSSKKGRKR